MRKKKPSTIAKASVPPKSTRPSKKCYSARISKRANKKNMVVKS